VSAISATVSTSSQQLVVSDGDRPIRTYAISTSRFGVGEQRGSFKTPRGRHVVRAKIGAGEPLGRVFVGRRATDEVYSEALARTFPERDWILTRILWLSGTEVGRNRLGDVDTMRRYIYIHGAPDSADMGAPSSIGCIRMRNADVAELFELLPIGSNVDIG
jgi:lipoprotein-anchoring transpeptidase ErfK/SrfK